MKNEVKDYYLGLDIGTNSVGYAATDFRYNRCKFNGEPVMGVHLFEDAEDSQSRRSFRTARRRLDRRKQRVELVGDIFAKEIGAIDPKFFIRLSESRLYREDSSDSFTLFNDSNYSDRDYHNQYPTIHHLIVDLIDDRSKHDPRLVYLAISWLVAHRGHFLFNVGYDDLKSLTDMQIAYDELIAVFNDRGEKMPWNDDISADVLLEIMTAKTGVRTKEDLFTEKVFGGIKPAKLTNEGISYDRASIVKLLCKGKAQPKAIFLNEEYEDIESISLDMDEENLAGIVNQLGDDGNLILALRKMYDCALLNQSLGSNDLISRAKVEVYDTHKADLEWLKYFVKKYLPEDYNAIFRDSADDNYVAYSYNLKDAKDKRIKKADKITFSDALLKKVRNVIVEEVDLDRFNDMCNRLSLYTFLPKQKDGDNRVIPNQLYYYELDTILKNASNYLSFLNETDDSGETNSDKIRDIFKFRVPYYVGPLNNYKSENAWIVRKAEGKILPWNFDEKVDRDASEQAFIRRMTNKCTYLPGEDVLPKMSLAYSRFMVLNEINPLKVNGVPIPVDVKQEIYSGLFEKQQRVTSKNIKCFLLANKYINKNDEISGIDITIKSSLKPYFVFKRMMDAGVLSEDEAEAIIERSTYSEDKTRLKAWLQQHYSKLSDEDIKYICKQKFSDFGRCSMKFLKQIKGVSKESGEYLSILDALWETNDNLMQILSDRYTFTDEIARFSESYYQINEQSLSQRMSEMYLSNAVRRPIIRALDVVDDVVTAMKGAPSKIFVEMARDVSNDGKGKRTQTRKQQILELYKKIKDEDIRALKDSLEEMGAMADNKLQSDKLFLYYMQLGKCMYSGEAIDLSMLMNDSVYNIDHIYPQSFIKDDSLLNNKVLVTSKSNGDKGNRYPVPDKYRTANQGYWKYLNEKGLITDEKYRRLTRAVEFTDDEKWEFINRQLVETRQSSKAIATILKEKYPNTEIVYVKAGLVSEFRQEFGMVKTRSINDLHHAKDAYLNIVVGNVYDMRFSKKWFSVHSEYSMRTKVVFERPCVVNGLTVWEGISDIGRIKGIVSKNAIHQTRYSFCRKGGLFDQQPLKKAEGLVPLKKGLPTDKYGGYRKPTASFYILASFSEGKKRDIMFVPIELQYADLSDDRQLLTEIVRNSIEQIEGKSVNDVEILLDGRKIKIGTKVLVDGAAFLILGKSSGGSRLITTCVEPVIITDYEPYVKKLDSLMEKRKKNPNIVVDSEHDGITKEKNIALYDVLTKKAGAWPYITCPASQYKVLKDGRERFVSLDLIQQAECLEQIMLLFGANNNGSDLTSIGGVKKAGVMSFGSKLSGIKKQYKDFRIVDQSPAGLFEKKTDNILELL